MTTAPVHATEVPAVAGSGYLEPFHTRMGRAAWRALGDHFELTQFGVSHKTLQPGARSSAHHWHETVDEFVMVVDGELVLHLGGRDHAMRAGDCVGFRAGTALGHHFENRLTGPATFVVVGTRRPGDTTHYPEDELAIARADDGSRWVHKDGRPYDRPPGRA